MSLYTRQNPDIAAQPINEFHWSLIQKQTKAVLVDIIRTFFNSKNIVIPSLFPYLSQKPSGVYVEKDFPFYERKIPLIVVKISEHSQLPTFIGSDNLLYIDKYIGDDGKLYGDEVFGGIDTLEVTCQIVADSSELRMELVDGLRMAISHLFKSPFLYRDADKSLFSIIPCNSIIRVGGESLLSGEVGLLTIYTTNVYFSVLVEYQFKDYLALFTEIQNFSINFEIT